MIVESILLMDEQLNHARGPMCESFDFVKVTLGATTKISVILRERNRTSALLR